MRRSSARAGAGPSGYVDAPAHNAAEGELDGLEGLGAHAGVTLPGVDEHVAVALHAVDLQRVVGRCDAPHVADALAAKHAHLEPA